MGDISTRSNRPETPAEVQPPASTFRGDRKVSSGLPTLVEQSFRNPGQFAAPGGFSSQIHESAYGELWKKSAAPSPFSIGEAAVAGVKMPEPHKTSPPGKTAIGEASRPKEGSTPLLIGPIILHKYTGAERTGAGRTSAERTSGPAPRPEARPELPAERRPEAQVRPQARPEIRQAGPDNLPPHRARMDAVPKEQVASYLHGDGRTLPPIAQDFARIGFSSIAASDAADARKLQVHVSTRAGDSRYPIGTAQNPYTSIQTAVDRAPAGSVVNVHRVGGDVYRERVDIGRSDLTLRTDRDNPAVIEPGRGAKGRGNAGISIRSGVYDVAIKNFEVRNFSGLEAGIKVDGANIRNITIAGNDVHGARGAEGIAVYGRGGNEATAVTGISIVSNKVHDLKLGRLEAVPINGNVSGFHVIGNAGYHLDNLFVDAIGGEGVAGKRELDHARGGVIEYNYASGITSVKNGGYGTGSAAAFYSDGATRLDIRYNYASRSDFGVEVGSEHGGYDSKGVHVYGNVFEASNIAWLTRGGPDAAGGGAYASSARDNLIIGGGKFDTQKGVSDFPVGDNSVFGRTGSVDRLPKPIAAMLLSRLRPRT